MLYHESDEDGRVESSADLEIGDRADIVITRLRPRVNSGVFLVVHKLSHKLVCLYQQPSLKSLIIAGAISVGYTGCPVTTLQ